jgi:hypothetical protein
MSDLISRLNDAAIALNRIATHNGGPPIEVDALIAILASLRRAIAVSRTTVSERRTRRPS